jgi:hypothetical protein
MVNVRRRIVSVRKGKGRSMSGKGGSVSCYFQFIGCMSLVVPPLNQSLICVFFCHILNIVTFFYSLVLIFHF